jgi:hypothetical protein
MYKHKLVDFIIQFMEEVDKEISEMKVRDLRNSDLSCRSMRALVSLPNRFVLLLLILSL